MATGNQWATHPIAASIGAIAAAVTLVAFGFMLADRIGGDGGADVEGVADSGSSSDTQSEADGAEETSTTEGRSSTTNGSTPTSAETTTSAVQPAAHPDLAEPGRTCIEGSSVDLLSADSATLQELRAIGPEKADLIIQARDAGQLEAFVDLRAVLGSLFAGEIAVNPLHCMSNGASLTYVIPKLTCEAPFLDLNAASTEEIRAATMIGDPSIDQVVRTRPFADLGQLFELSIGPALISQLDPGRACLGGTSGRVLASCPSDGIDLATASSVELGRLGVFQPGEFERIASAQASGGIETPLDIVMVLDYLRAGQVFGAPDACVNGGLLTSLLPAAECDDGQVDANTASFESLRDRTRLTQATIETFMSTRPFEGVGQIYLLDRGASLAAHLALANMCLRPQTAG